MLDMLIQNATLPDGREHMAVSVQEGTVANKYRHTSGWISS
jgi:hypothetical protein